MPVTHVQKSERFLSKIRKVEQPPASFVLTTPHKPMFFRWHTFGTAIAKANGRGVERNGRIMPEPVNLGDNNIRVKRYLESLQEKNSSQGYSEPLQGIDSYLEFTIERCKEVSTTPYPNMYHLSKTYGRTIWGRTTFWVSAFNNSRSAVFSLDNPIHEVITRESAAISVTDEQKIVKTYENLAEIFLKARERFAANPNMSPQQKLKTVYKVMRKMGFFFGAQRESLFIENIASKKVDCDTSSLVVIAIGHELGWPVYIIDLPDHVFVRWDDGQWHFNIDYGDIRDDKKYTKEYYISKEELGSIKTRNLTEGTDSRMYLSETKYCESFLKKIKKKMKLFYDP